MKYLLALLLTATQAYAISDNHQALLFAREFQRILMDQAADDGGRGKAYFGTRGTGAGGWYQQNKMFFQHGSNIRHDWLPEGSLRLIAGRGGRNFNWEPHQTSEPWGALILKKLPGGDFAGRFEIFLDNEYWNWGSLSRRTKRYTLARDNYGGDRGDDPFEWVTLRQLNQRIAAESWSTARDRQRLFDALDGYNGFNGFDTLPPVFVWRLISPWGKDNGKLRLAARASVIAIGSFYTIPDLWGDISFGIERHQGFQDTFALDKLIVDALNDAYNYNGALGEAWSSSWRESPDGKLEKRLSVKDQFVDFKPTTWVTKSVFHEMMHCIQNKSIDKWYERNYVDAPHGPFQKAYNPDTNSLFPWMDEHWPNISSIRWKDEGTANGIYHIDYHHHNYDVMAHSIGAKPFNIGHTQLRPEYVAIAGLCGNYGIYRVPNSRKRFNTIISDGLEGKWTYFDDGSSQDMLTFFDENLN